MKILFALTYYSPHWTGLTEHAKRFAEALSEKGHNVTVVATQHQKDLPKEEVLNRVKIRRSASWGRVSRTVLSPGYIWQVFLMMRSVDVVVCYTPFTEILFVGLLAKVLSKRFIIVHNGDLILPKGFFNRLIQMLFDVTTFLGGVLADQLIAYSDDYARHSRFLRQFLSKTVAIFPLFKPVSIKQSDIVAMKNKLPKSSLIIGCAGRFVEEKGFDILLQAIPSLVKIYPEAVVVFAGEINIVYESFYQANGQRIQEAGKAFISLGLLTQKEMAAFYRSIDLFVLPSRSDCLALVQVEAMLAGVPVVVTDIPGARVPVITTGMGVIVSSQDPEALALGIIKAIKQKYLLVKKKDQLERLVNNERSLAIFEAVLAGKSESYMS